MPTSDPDRDWPSCDDDQPGVSIRPLSQADLAALLNQHHHEDRGDDLPGPGGPAPVLAVRVRASVGRPGASAHARYRRRRAIEWTAWTHSLPWRAAAILAGGLGAELLAAQLLPPLAGLAGLLAAAILAGDCASGSPLTPWPGGAARSGSGAPPASWPRSSGAAGRSCMTWPSRVRRRTSITW
jgi:hypothetical protein